jgi:hypothetical protein
MWNNVRIVHTRRNIGVASLQERDDDLTVGVEKVHKTVGCPQVNKFPSPSLHTHRSTYQAYLRASQAPTIFELLRADN